MTSKSEAVLSHPEPVAANPLQSNSLVYQEAAPVIANTAHPEPVAPEAVAWKEFDHTTIDYVLRYGGRCRECADHLGLCPTGLPCDVDDAKTAIRWVLKALNYGIANGFLAHPSPSPEQGEDDLVQRLRASSDEVLHGPTGEWASGAYPTIYDEAATAISTLRARVAELEARATPQAGAEVRSTWWKPSDKLATAARDLTNIREDFDAEDGDRRGIVSALCAAELHLVKAVVLDAHSQLDGEDQPSSPLIGPIAKLVLAALSNQGSSSNG